MSSPIWINAGKWCPQVIVGSLAACRRGNDHGIPTNKLASTFGVYTA